MPNLFEKLSDEEVALSGLREHGLSSVTFVQDYVQLSFDGPSITAITLPTVTVDETEFGPMAAGYRDRLCGQIGKVVLRASIYVGQWLEIQFVDGSLIRVSLLPANYRAAEAIVVRGQDGAQWASW